MKHNLLPIPKLQYLQIVKYNLHHLLISCNNDNSYVHSCKFAEMGNYLLKFLQSIDKYNSPSIASQKEANVFNSLISSIQEMKSYAKRFNKENFLNAIISDKISSVTDKLNEFRGNFNKMCSELNLGKPYPQSARQFIVNDMEDSKFLLNILNELVNNPNGIIENNLEIIKMRILELYTIINDCKESIYKKDIVLSPEEIAKDLEPYKKVELDLVKDYFVDDKNIIGRGGYSIVYLGYQKDTNKIVAVKQLLSPIFTKKSIEMFKREINAFLDAQHPCLIPFVGVTLKNPYCIVTEYMNGGSLYQRLHQVKSKTISESDKQLSPTKKTIIAIGVAHGMCFLHSKKMIHRDLKSLNILLDSNDQPKICDFGLSRFQNSDSEIMSKGVGTSQWMAPEVISSEHYNSKADVYSFGILMWEMLTEEIPFQDVWDVGISMQVLQNDKRPEIPEDCPQKMSSFIACCWDRNPDNRPDFKAIIRLLDQGEVEFAGTERNQVIEYIKSITTTGIDIFNEISDALINNNSDNSHEISSNEEENGREKRRIYQSFLNQQSLEEKIKQLSNNEIKTTIIYILSNSNDTKKIIFFIQQCIFFHPNLFQDFETLLSPISHFFYENINEDLINIYKHILKENYQYLSETLTYRELERILLYLNNSVNLENSIELLYVIISKQLIKNQSDVIAVVPQLISLLKNSSNNNVHHFILLIFHEIMNLPSFVTIINENDGQIPLIKSVLKEPENNLKLIEYIFLNSDPHRQCSYIIVSKLKLMYDLNNIFALKVLNILLSKLPSSYSEFRKLPIDTIHSIFDERNDIPVILYSLKNIFLLLSNSLTSDIFLNIYDIIENHLNEENEKIVILSALCLTQTPKKYLTKLCNPTISHFFEKILQSNMHSQKENCALRLAGVMTSTKEGSSFILKHINLIFPILKRNDEKGKSLMEAKHLTLIIFASLSAYFQNVNIFEQCIDIMVNNIEKYEKYPLIFLTNIVINNKMAIICSRNIKLFIRLLKSGKKDVFPIIWRISTLYDTFNIISEHMHEIVKSLIPFLDSDIHSLILDIFKTVSCHEQGKKALQIEKIDEYLSLKLQEDELCGMQTTYLQLLMRIKNDS